MYMSMAISAVAGYKILHAKVVSVFR